jgi:hypothetical protein
VGSNFARIDPNGAMVKNRDGKMRPINVDVPLCAVVPDVFKQVESSLDDETRQELNAELRKKISLGPGEFLSGVAAFLTRPAGIVVRTLMPTTLDSDMVTMFFDLAAQPYRDKASKIADDRKTGELQLELFQRAQQSVLENFTKTVLRLEAIFPNSQLARK